MSSIKRPRLVIGTAVLQSISLPTWLLAFAYTDVTRAITLLFFHPVTTSLLDAIVNRRKPRLHEVGLALLAFSGVAIMGHEGFRSGGVQIGDVLAVISSVCWSAISVMQPRIGDSREGLLGLSLGGLAAAAIMLPLAYIGKTVPAPSSEALTLVVTLGLMDACTWVLFATAAQRITPAMGGLLLYVEFLVTFVIGLTVFGEKPTTEAYIGTAIILLATAIGIFAPFRNRQKSKGADGAERTVPAAVA